MRPPPAATGASADAAQRGASRFPRVWPWLVVATLWAAGSLGWTDLPELKTLDWRFNYRGPQHPHPAIHLLAIDDASLARIGRWPWPRQDHANFIDALQEAAWRPRVIGYDVLFTERQAEHLEYDAELGRASRQAGTLSHAYFFTLDTTAPLRAATPEVLQRWALGSEASALPAPLVARQVTLPIAEVRDSGRLGYVDAPPGPDGVTRYLPLVMAYQGRLYPSLSLQLACAYWGVEPRQFQVARGGDWGWRLEARRSDGALLRIPVDHQGRLLVNYVGDLGAFQPLPVVTAIGLMNAVHGGRPTPQTLTGLRDGIVLIGAAAVGMGDVKVTPVAPTSFGFLVHANALDNLLSRRFIHRLPGWLTGLLLLGMCLVLGEAAARLAPLRAALVCLVLLAAYVAAALAGFVRAGWWLELVRPVLAGGATFLGITLYRFSREEREKRWIRQAFGRFVSPQILGEILAHPERLQLGGQRRELTVLFSDVRGFTTFCEQHSPEEVVEVLNTLLDRLTAAVLRHGGTLDKYVGDAIMAIFGAPGQEAQADHAQRACAAALDMVQTLRQWQQERRAAGQEVLDIDIGINTGPMVVGNMGSSQVMSYTVIGDAVNLGARVEGLTRQYQCAVVITEATYRQVRGQFEAEPIGDVHVKGKEQTVMVYKLLRAQPATTGMAA